MNRDKSQSSSSAGVLPVDWLASHSRWIEKSSESNFGLGPVYVVCMERRFEHTRNFLEKNGLSGRVSILRAFTPEQVDKEELFDLGIIPPYFSREGGLNKINRVVCIALGHLACWFDAQRAQAGPALFLEDDLISTDERDSVSKVIELASAHSWDFLYLSYCHAMRGRCRAFSDELIELQGQLCTNAYALTPSALGSLLNSAFPIQAPIDVYMRNQAKVQGLLALGARSLLFQQDRSVVQSSFGRERFVSSPVWHPTLGQKLVSRGHSLLTFSGGPGYDEAIYLIDRHRQGLLTEEERRHSMIRAWDILQCFRSLGYMR